MFNFLKKKQPKNTFYEGGKRTLANRDFYNAASEFELTAKPHRTTMRARARWLAANNPIMANIDKAIINNTIGVGIKPQSKIGKTEIDDAIELAFLDWANDCDYAGQMNFYDMQRIILESRIIDGEIFIHKIQTPEGLRLNLIEADSLDEQKGNNGITYDAAGRPLQYHFINANREPVTIAADEIINYFKKERHSQKRGITEYKQAMVDIKNFSAYQRATIEAARARANVSMIIESERESGVFNVDSGGQDEDILDINGLMVYYLRAGESVKSFDYNNGGANYGEFATSTIRLMATARRVSYELAFRDYSQVNFSSARASLIQDNKTFDYEQAHFSRYVLDNIFKSWIKNEINLGRLPISRNEYTKNAKLYHQIRWSFPKREWVDPVKDLTALAMEINLGLTTRTDACMKRGIDYEEVIETQKREMDYKKATLGEHYAEAMAVENRNHDLLEIILGGTEENAED